MNSYEVPLDTGLDISAAHNAVILGINLSDIDKMVLSHGHCNHSHSLSHVLEARRRENEVIANPDIWASKYSCTFGSQEQYARILSAREALGNMGHHLN